jgi:hypothetical protein
MRRNGPIIVGLISGLVVIVANFFVGTVMQTLRNEVTQWQLIAGAFAVLVGSINLCRIHMTKISRKKEDRFFSWVLLVGFFGFLLFGLPKGSSSHPQFQWVFKTSLEPMSATMFALLVFYIASAAYRAFRVKTPEATVLLLAAVILMLGKVSVGRMISEWIPQASSWLLDYPNTAGMRGITIGAALGAVATAFRVLIGIERGHLGGIG